MSDEKLMVLEFHLTHTESTTLLEKAKAAGLPFPTWARMSLGLPADPSLPARPVQIQAAPPPVSGNDLDGTDEAVALEERLSAMVSNATPFAGDGHVPEDPKAPIQGNQPAPPLAAGHQALPEHACKHLVREYGTTFGPNQCQGTCYSARQKGRVCMWPSAQARQCAHFEALRINRGSTARP